MAGRKRIAALEVVKPSGRRRMLEIGKDILIVVLVCSALYLTAQNQAYAGLGQIADAGWLGDVVRLFHGQRDPVDDGRQPTQSVSGIHPVRMAVCSQAKDGGETAMLRYGLQYSAEETDALYNALGGYLSEGLASACDRRPVTEAQWRQALEAPGIYVDLLGSLPLETLCDWTSAGQGNPALEGAARHLVLAVVDGGHADLYYINEEDGSYYAYDTAVDYAGRLKSALESYSDNGALFAFEQESWPLSPYVMLQPERAQTPESYRISNPAGSNATTGLEGLQRVLGFPYQYTSGDEIVLWEGNERVRVDADGTVTYRATDSGDAARYPVPSAGEKPTRTELLEAVNAIVAKTVAAQCGEARVYLTSLVRQEDGSWQADFGYSLNGAVVLLSGEAPAARFTIREGQITDYVLRFRSYERTGQATPVMRERQAVAAMGALHLKGKTLELCYADTGGDLAQAKWAVR